MKVLVCGGRKYADKDRVAEELYTLATTREAFSLLIEGGATGADRLARNWAKRQGIHVATVDALWDFFNHSAGPRRNTAMLAIEPDLCVAFPGGSGTEDMVKKAIRAGIEVVRVTDSANASRET